MRILLTGGSGFIGTNFVQRAVADGHELRDLSHLPPLNPAHNLIWRECNILNGSKLTREIQDFSPEAVLHLAARAECDEDTTVEAGYRQNTAGTSNLLEAVGQTRSVKRLIITSTQYVCGPGPLPQGDEDYFPHTIYGASKVETERLVRSAELDCVWTIIRPTNIWGPWHLRYRREFWRIAERGLYFHPGNAPIVRCYGYVGNVVDQMLTIFSADREAVDRRTFYVGDAPDDIYKWANAFCQTLNGKSARRIPRLILRAAAFFGDGISKVTKRPFYITTSRFKNMITDYRTPMDGSFDVIGPGRYTLEEGVAETARWLHEYRPTESEANRQSGF